MYRTTSMHAQPHDQIRGLGQLHDAKCAVLQADAFEAVARTA